MRSYASDLAASDLKTPPPPGRSPLPPAKNRRDAYLNLDYYGRTSPPPLSVGIADERASGRPIPAGGELCTVARKETMRLGMRVPVGDMLASASCNPGFDCVQSTLTHHTARRKSIQLN
jgi:hypothetical protein